MRPVGNLRLLILGGGNMGGAIVRGLVRARLARGADITLIEPDAKRREGLAGLGVRAFPSLESAERRQDGNSPVLLAVKPQVFPELATSLGTLQGLASQPIVSIMAGVTTGAIASALGAPRVVRTMPNLGVSVSLGMTAIAPGSGALPEDAELAATLFGALGETINIPEELIDAFTAVAGSGPAYAFLLAEAMEAAAQRVGFSADQSRAIVRQTLRGSAELLAGADQSAAAFRASVTSKGGTTAAALAVFESAGFLQVVERAITAARDRGRELGRGRPASLG